MTILRFAFRLELRVRQLAGNLADVPGTLYQNQVIA